HPSTDLAYRSGVLNETITHDLTYLPNTIESLQRHHHHSRQNSNVSSRPSSGYHSSTRSSSRPASGYRVTIAVPPTPASASTSRPTSSTNPYKAQPSHYKPVVVTNKQKYPFVNYAQNVMKSSSTSSNNNNPSSKPTTPSATTPIIPWSKRRGQLGCES